MSGYIREQIGKLKSLFNSKTYTKEDCKIIHCSSPDVTQILANGIGNKKYRIATSGYSFEQEGYRDTTLKFIRALDKELGSKSTGYITTPALAEGSIYDITTQVSGFGAKNVAYFTTDYFWENTDFDSFRQDVNMKKYSQTPIYMFPDTETYIKATANASNILICTGGKTTAVSEVVEALKSKNRVILLINENLKDNDFDQDKQIPNSAAMYFFKYVGKFQKDLLSINELDLQYIRTHPGRINQLLRVYIVSDNKSIEAAAEHAANFLEGKSLYDFFPNKTDEIDASVSQMQKDNDIKTAYEHYEKNGELKFLFNEHKHFR